MNVVCRQPMDVPRNLDILSCEAFNPSVGAPGFQVIDTSVFGQYSHREPASPNYFQFICICIGSHSTMQLFDVIFQRAIHHWLRRIGRPFIRLRVVRSYRRTLSPIVHSLPLQQTALPSCYRCG